MRTSSGGAFCSIAVEIDRVAGQDVLALRRLTEHDVPVAIPVRTTSRTPQRLLEPIVEGGQRRWLSAAASTARSASSSCRMGRPNTATIASPMIFSILPPWDSKTRAHLVEVEGQDLAQ